MSAVLQPCSSQHIAEEMLSWLDLELMSCMELQTLWAGYGHICAVKARPSSHLMSKQTHDGDINAPDSSVQHLILKIISPPPSRPGTDEGHLRKVFSYEVEQHFYDAIAPTLSVPVAKCLASTSRMRKETKLAGFGDLSAILLSDLRLRYPVAAGKRASLNSRQVHSALRWLAGFHRSYWQSPCRQQSDLILPPLEEARKRKLGKDSECRAIWLNGGYTYLATRLDEYASLARDADSEWSGRLCRPVEGSGQSIAELAAAFLAPCGRAYETYLHGDVKSENMFSNQSGDEVAFFDFQYVGVGVGVCDLAKLLTCSVSVDMLQSSHETDYETAMSRQEAALLDMYRNELLSQASEGVTPEYEWEDLKRHWETALVDWCRFQASWGFWGNTNWLQSRVRSILRDEGWSHWLKCEVRKLGRGNGEPVEAIQG